MVAEKTVTVLKVQRRKAITIPLSFLTPSVLSQVRTLNASSSSSSTTIWIDGIFGFILHILASTASSAAFLAPGDAAVVFDELGCPFSEFFISDTFFEEADQKDKDSYC